MPAFYSLGRCPSLSPEESFVAQTCPENFVSTVLAGVWGKHVYGLVVKQMRSQKMEEDED